MSEQIQSPQSAEPQQPPAKIQKLYKVVMAYGPWPIGHVFTEMPPNAAKVLLDRGWIRETAPRKRGGIRAPIDRMINTVTDAVSKRRRGRPSNAELAARKAAETPPPDKAS